MARRTRGREERLLRLSVWAAVAFAVTALVWGIAVRSQLIVFDGLYSTISVALSWTSLLAYRAIARGPDDRHPFGREVLSSVVVLVKGVAIGVLCLYALAGAVLDLLGGGRDVAAGWAAGYAAAATVGCAVVVVLLRRGGDGAGVLVRAESAQWLLDTILSAAILVGFVFALVLQGTGRSSLAAYVDPGMVAIVATWFLRLPVQLIREGWHGLVARDPDDAAGRAVRQAVAEVARAAGCPGHDCRIATFGERLDVEVTLLVDGTGGPGDPAALDAVRDELDRRLAEVAVTTRVAVTCTADPQRLHDVV